MNIGQIVDVQISRQTKFPTAAGFGTPAVLDINTVQADDVLVVTDVDDMIAAGFTTADQAYKAVAAILSQNPRVGTVKVLKRAANVAQVDTIQVTGTDDGNYTITLNGVAFTFAAAGNTVGEIRDGLVAAINGGAEPVTAAPSGGDSLTLTDDVAGTGFSAVLTSNPGDSMVLTHTTANVGPTTELARLRLLDDDWYFLGMTDHTRAMQELVAEYIEALTKIFFLETSEADSKDLTPASDTTSLLATLKAAGYDRIVSCWTAAAKLTNYPSLGWVGKGAPKTPGSITWKFKTAAGQTADDGLSATEESNVLGKNGNLYLAVAGISMFAEGKVASGEFIDIIHGTDLILARIQENVFGLLVTEDKVPMDNGGITAVALKVEEVLQNVGVANGILRGGDDAPVVTAPDISEVPQADRATRYLSTIEFEGFYAGAIHKVAIRGRLTV